jgi:hypothetical protein
MLLHLNTEPLPHILENLAPLLSDLIALRSRAITYVVQMVVTARVRQCLRHGRSNYPPLSPQVDPAALACLNGPSARVQDTRPGPVASPGVEQMETMRGGDSRG